MTKKEEIQQVAINLFLEKGYSNVTIMDICNALNITKPTFYKYVNAKEDLILDLYDFTVEEITSNTLLVLQADSNIERLIIIFNDLINKTLAFKSDLFSQMLISNLNQNHHSFDMRNKMTDLCILLISKAQKNKEIKNPADPKLLYQTIAYCFTGYETMWCIRNGETDIKKDYFNSFNTVLQISDEYKEVYKKYI
ncbi:MAG: TetR/AcrR family transcriptional regulator [Erysipelotrichaceae bacterium]|nr:TetR/AcrR family transcriptional regulator [Erysipelotrichaceae bacterium]